MCFYMYASFAYMTKIFGKAIDFYNLRMKFKSNESWQSQIITRDISSSRLKAGFSNTLSKFQ